MYIYVKDNVQPAACLFFKGINLPNSVCVRPCRMPSLWQRKKKIDFQYKLNENNAIMNWYPTKIFGV